MREHAVDPRGSTSPGCPPAGPRPRSWRATYPDLYAAVGVHSGLPSGAASDLPSAFAAMRQGGGRAAADPGSGGAPGREQRRIVPTIVFHGDGTAR